MKVIVKKRYQEFVEYIEHPMLVYIYETGRVIAANIWAREIIGDDCKNINTLWENRMKLKLPKEVLDNGTEIIYNKSVLIPKGKIEVDIEFNSISLDNSHIIICFMEQSYKQQFTRKNNVLVPRIYWKDKKHTLLGANHFHVYDIGILEEEAYGQREYLNQSTQGKLDKEEKWVLISKQIHYNMFCELVCKSGKSFLANMNYMPIINKNGTCVGFLVVYSLVLEKQRNKKFYEDILAQNSILNKAINKSDKIVLSCTLDEDTRVDFITSNFRSFGYNLEHFHNGKLTWKDVIHPEDYQRLQNEDYKNNFLEKGAQIQEYRILTADGKSVWVRDETISITKRKEKLYRESMLSEMGMRKKVGSDQYPVENYRDYLTNLPNRLKFEYDIVEAVESAVKNNSYGYMLSFDLDDFQNINDGLGHEYGDILLKNIARFISGIPQLKDFCYRAGGDEFLVIIRDQYAKEAEQIIGQLFEAFRKPWRLYGKEYYCTMSMGIAKFPTDSTNATELLRYADLAQVEAKKEGKNRVSYFEPRVESRSMKRINMEKYLRKAITSDCYEFEVYFQPIVDSKDKSVIGGEALLRWRSPELGFINPMDFLPLSEYLGLIVPIGEFVLKEAFLVCKSINDRTDATFTMHINLSVVQLIQPNIVSRIMEIARTVDVKRSNVVFEVTESLAIEDMVLMKSVLQELKDNDFRIALDDFGTGYASLNHIMEIPLDYIKIDKSFISNYGTKQFNPSLITAITELAHSMNVEVVVEGVETKQQMEFLMFLNIDKYQGFLYGMPVSKDEFFVNYL